MAPMSRRRRAYEAGHKAKFLVVVDDTEECDRAVYFASRRAVRTGVKVLMLHVIEMLDTNQQWLGVADIMRAEAHEEAQALLDKHAVTSTGITGIVPERVIREGDRVTEMLALIEEDEDIAIMILGASIDKGGPGPLVSSLAAGKFAGTFPIPIVVVPGNLSLDAIKALA